MSLVFPKNFTHCAEEILLTNIKSTEIDIIVPRNIFLFLIKIYLYNHNAWSSNPSVDLGAVKWMLLPVMSNVNWYPSFKRGWQFMSSRVPKGTLVYWSHNQGLFELEGSHLKYKHSFLFCRIKFKNKWQSQWCFL